MTHKDSYHIKSIVTVIAVAMFFSCKSNLEDVKKFGISQNAPVGETEAINLKYTDSGKVIANLISPKMFDFSNREFSFSEFPKGIHLTLFDNNKNKTVITADYGVVYNVTNLIDLQGNVVIARHTNDTIFAKQLYYNQRREWLFTNLPISFRLDGDMGYGKGFDADVNFNNFDIIEMSGVRSVEN